MRFETLSIAGFLSYGVPASVLDFRGAGITLIDGLNGQGKSSITEALIWCLYGTTIRGYEGDDVINRHLGKDCCVILELTGSNGLVYRVIRARKDSTWRTGLRLFCAGEDISQPSVTGTQEQLDRLLEMTSVTAIQSLVFGGTSAYRFSALTDKEQKAIFDDALGISQYVAARELASSESKELRAETQQLVISYQAKETQLANLRVRKDQLSADAKEWRTKQDGKIFAISTQLTELRAEIASEKGAVYPAVPDSEEWAATQVKVARAKLDAALRAATALETQHLRQLEDVEERGYEIQDAQKLQGDCKTCGQTVTPAACARLVAALTVRLEEAKQVALDLNTRLEAARKAQEVARRLVGVADQALTAARSSRVAKNQRHAALEVLRRDRTRLKAELDALHQETSPYQALLTSIEGEIATLEREVAEVSGKLVELGNQLKLYDFWIEAFGPKGVRSLLIDTALPLLNSKASEYAQVLTGGETTIEFKTQAELKSGKTAERFEVSVQGKNGAGSYRGHSAGERAKIDLCVGLALQSLVTSRSAANVNVAFYDEVFDSLDEAGTEAAVQLLMDVAQNREATFIISHNAGLKAYFSNSIGVEKTESGSRIREA